MKRSKSNIPGPTGHFLLGSLPEIQRDRVKFLVDLQRDHGDVVHIRLGPADAVVIYHPDDIQHVLQDNQANYSKKTPIYTSLGALCGNGLVCSDGDFWLRQRRLMQPAFHRRHINDLSDMVGRETQITLDRWDATLADGRVFDLSHEMMRLSLAIVTQALFGIRLSDPEGAMAQNIAVVQVDPAFRFEHPFYPPRWVPTARNRQYKTSKEYIDQVIYDLIDERRSNPDLTGDLLAMLMQATAKADPEQAGGSEFGMSDQQLRDEAITLLLAGHETTALALTWALYLLNQHPEAEARLRLEVEQVLGGRPPTVADLPQLPYTQRVLDEGMRLYPPAWILERKALADDEIGGYHIPAGTILGLTPYATHRHPKFWDQPETFDPDRFAPERSKDRPHFAYFPFGGGPRQCIGNSFALMEIQLILPMLMQRHRFELEPGQKVHTDPEIALRPKGGLWMRLHPVSVPAPVY